MYVHGRIGLYKPITPGGAANAPGTTQELEVPVPSKPSIPCVCERCGITFLVAPYRIQRGAVRFCSTECKYAAMLKPRVDRTCVACGSTFTATQYDVDRGLATFCSYACHNSGVHHPSWKGGRRLNSRGYVRVRVAGRGDVLEHRLVMETHIGRSLLPTEVVHHINGNKQDNRIENLEIMNHGEHTRHHNLQGGDRYDRGK